MNNQQIHAAELAADYLIFHLAALAGVGEDDAVEAVDEIDMDFGGRPQDAEMWTRFTVRDIEGLQYVAHLPGSIDANLSRVVRDHALVFAGRE